MTHFLRRPELVATAARFPYGEVELDKTPDGRYWQVLGSPDAGVVLRLRIAHYSVEYEADTFIAEVKTNSPDDPSGRSNDGFEVVGEFSLSFYEMVDVGFEEMRKSDEFPLDGFPNVWRDEFEGLVCCWGRVLHVMECGLAVGSATLAPDLNGDDQSAA